ncbi:hypothetical protein E2C01_023558 [Portunus trituberculatus]|uniref:Uncharacterized protein n=1 Tax=Portunus trituberculatus TaxID=210409 RepID=A0A5B7EAV4_PORTR|nr:hypothetical protein [Portunus trituberculatus]
MKRSEVTTLPLLARVNIDSSTQRFPTALLLLVFSQISGTTCHVEESPRCGKTPKTPQETFSARLHTSRGPPFPAQSGPCHITAPGQLTKVSRSSSRRTRLTPTLGKYADVSWGVEWPRGWSVRGKARREVTRGRQPEESKPRS